jgi:hypothetical protein
MHMRPIQQLRLYTIKFYSFLLTTVKNGLCLGKLMSMKGGVTPLTIRWCCN